MADEELQADGAEEQKDLQSATDQTDLIDDAADDDTDRASEDDYGVDMDQVEAVLNATADKNMMTPQMQRMMARQAESTKRVEESIKGTKSNPRSFVPLFCVLMVMADLGRRLLPDRQVPDSGHRRMDWRLVLSSS